MADTGVGVLRGCTAWLKLQLEPFRQRPFAWCMHGFWDCVAPPPLLAGAAMWLNLQLEPAVHLPAAKKLHGFLGEGCGPAAAWLNLQLEPCVHLPDAKKLHGGTVIGAPRIMFGCACVAYT